MTRLNTTDEVDSDPTASTEPDGSGRVEIEGGDKLTSNPGGVAATSRGELSGGANGRLRRRGMLAVAGAALAIGAAACGVTEGRFNAINSEAEELKAENRRLEREINKLNNEQAAAAAESGGAEHEAAPSGEHPRAVPRANVVASFNPDVIFPEISERAYVDVKASVIGRVTLSEGVYVAPTASARGDEGGPIFVGAGSNLQDGVVMHGLETFEEDHGVIAKNLVEAHGSKYSVYIGANTSLAHQCHVHGPAMVGENTFVGMQALIFKAIVGTGCVIEPAATIISVSVPDGRYVPAGTVLTSQDVADDLPVITPDYGFATINAAVLHVNQQLAAGYGGLGEADGH